MTVSVIIPSWDSASNLMWCLRALSYSSLNRLAPSRLEVVVCDDGSTDDTWQNLHQFNGITNLHALKLPHRGQSAALNAGINHAQGDLMVFCDADMVLGCGALDELLARHELWSDCACFGFRSNINPSRLPTDDLGLLSLLHTEAFSLDNRVAFDLPTLVPNMMDATGWLHQLTSGRYMIDSQGSEWPRHRFLYGCLFSATRDLVLECEGFPDGLNGWGYNDTLIAARMEASGAFLMPVASAWGHHIQHDIRHADQWFQGNRNRLAYKYLLQHPLSSELWQGKSIEVEDAHTLNCEPAVVSMKPTDIKWDEQTLLALGRWQECLDFAKIRNNDRVVDECLFHLNLHDQAIAESLPPGFWRALNYFKAGQKDIAAELLWATKETDRQSSYACSSSIPELLFLADHYESMALFDIMQRYRDVAEIRAFQISAR